MDVQNFETLQKSQNLGIFLSDLFESTTFIRLFFLNFMVIVFVFHKIIKSIFFIFQKSVFLKLEKPQILRFGIYDFHNKIFFPA